MDTIEDIALVADELQILVIDDQASMRKIVRSLLRETGLTNVSDATNGRDAFEKLTDPDFESPDVILCDLHMDEMSGIEFVHKFRRRKSLPNREIPIVVLTGDSSALMHDVALQVGATAILEKPVSALVLRRTIELAIGYEL